MPRDDGSDQRPRRRSRARPRQPEPGPANRPANAAELVGTPRSLPRTLAAGGSYEVTVVMRNTGRTTWRADGDQPHRLGSQNPRDNTRWGLGRIDVPADVPPGAEVSFSFTVIAPTTPGTYHFQWQMVQDGVGWFGEPSPDVVVHVALAPRL